MVVIGGALAGASCCCGDDGGGTMTTADKDAMGGSVGDTGVFGSVAVTLSAGAGVPTVLAGAGPGRIVDGWEVRYSKLLVAVGDFQAVVTDDNGTEHPIGDGSVQIVDLAAVPSEGVGLREFDRIEVGTTSQVGFSIVAATASAEQSALADAADLARMVDNGYAMYIEGVIVQKTGESCTPGAPDECQPADTIRFAWGIKAGTSYADCRGFEVEDGAPTEVDLTLPGDRWLQVNFNPMSSERRAQWIADADLDHDGETTVEELAQIPATDLFPADLYDLSRPISPVTTAFDFLVAQARATGRASVGTCRTITAL